MKRFLFGVLLLLGALSGMAQTKDNPILLTINGKPVTRGEFEYAYNKNNGIEGAVEKKTIKEYLDMFINYKLKVAAAEALRMDTLASFRQEFNTYRDLQLNAGLLDQAFIDSVARRLYDDYVKRVDGADLLTVSHILLAVPQKATDAELQRTAQRADSIYQALVQGADFAEMARKVSQDPGTALKGGELPTIAKGMTYKEFEDQVYALQPGQMTRPFLSPAGYHIVWLKSRKPLDSYETLYPTIIASLKRQGIEEVSANRTLEKLMATGRTREAVLDSTFQAMLVTNPDLKYLVQEYHDGLLLYEVAKQTVWDRAEKDVAGLAHTFKANKKKYVWKQPRFKGYIIGATDVNTAKKAQKLLQRSLASGDELQASLKHNFDGNPIPVEAKGPYLVERGENSTIDYFVFGDKDAQVKSLSAQRPITAVAGSLLKRPMSYEDVKSQVVADYQQKLEDEWVAQLRKHYSFKVNEEVLKTVNNHK